MSCDLPILRRDRRIEHPCSNLYPTDPTDQQTQQTNRPNRPTDQQTQQTNRPTDPTDQETQQTNRPNRPTHNRPTDPTDQQTNRPRPLPEDVVVAVDLGAPPRAPQDAPVAHHGTAAAAGLVGALRPVVQQPAVCGRVEDGQSVQQRCGDTGDQRDNNNNNNNNPSITGTRSVIYVVHRFSS